MGCRGCSAGCKVDYLSTGEVAQARAFTERVVAAELGRPVPVWPVSARHGLDARQRGDETGAAASGLAAFQAAFTGYLTAYRDADLAETNEQAAALTREATGPLRHAVLTHLTGLNGPLGEVEQAALDDAAARIRNVVDDWREGRSADLDAALRALEERLSARLDEHIAAVRRTAGSAAVPAARQH